jgi:hypothetical protein
MVMLRKSCRSLLTEPNKIALAFFWIFYDFLGFYQVTGLKC